MARYPDEAKDFEIAACSDATTAAGSGQDSAPGPADTPTRRLPSCDQASEQAGGGTTATEVLRRERDQERRRVDAVALAYIAAESGGYVTVENFAQKYGQAEADILMERGRQKAREFLAMYDAAFNFDLAEAQRVRQPLVEDIVRAMRLKPGNLNLEYVGDHS